jgi:hypothetical protein
MRHLIAIFTLSLATPAFAAAKIAIKAESSDRGIKLKVDAAKNAITIRGTAHGPTHHGQLIMGQYDYWMAKGASFTLDIDKAPTTNAFGKTDFTLKNRRLFTIDTSKGWGAGGIADHFAMKVNDRPDFTAQVTHHEDGSATISFAKRAQGSPFGIFDPFGIFAPR